MQAMDRRLLLRAAAVAIIFWTIGFFLILLDVPVVDIVFIVLGSLAGVITWVIALLMAIRRQQWGWVIGIVVTNYLGALLYAVAQIDETA